MKKGSHHSAETIKLISENRKGKAVGEDNPFFGKHHTPEARRHMSQAHKGKRIGEANSFWGRHHTAEVKAQSAERMRRRRGVLAANWRGGRRNSGLGYIQVKIQPDSPFYAMVSRCGYVMEHRLIVAEYLSRCLYPWEVVHHKNGIKDDNRLENLELLPYQAGHLSIQKMQHRIEELEQEVKLLRWQVKQINTRTFSPDGTIVEIT